MKQYLLIVRTRPLPGWEAEFHAWYDGTHLAELLEIPDFAAAQRFAPMDVPPVQDADGRFVAVYTLETDDIERSMARFNAEREGMAVPDCLDVDGVSFELWQELGPKREAVR